MLKETIYCDRCGRICDYIRDCHSFQLRKNLYFLEQWRNGSTQKVDLCQSCYDSLAEWVKSGKVI